MATPPRVKRQGWAQGRADTIHADGVREAVLKQALKSAAERAATSRLCTEAIDNILKNHWLILPSREVKTQKHYNGHVPTVTFRAGSIDGDGAAHGKGIASYITHPAREDHLSIRNRHKWTGNAVGRPAGPAQGPGPREQRMLHNRLVWNKVKRTQPQGVEDWAWQILKQRYGLDHEIPEIAKVFHITDVAARQRLSRATRQARDLGMDFK